MDEAKRVRQDVQRVLRALAREGLLLVTDPVLPSVVTLVAGRPVHGSWWSHDASHHIWAVLQHLEHHERTLLVKLVSGKQTFVDEALWQALLSIASAKERWQMEGLSSPATHLLGKVEARGTLRLDQLPGEKKALKKAAGDLQARLLVHSQNVHTEAGSHATVLSAWKTSAKELGLAFLPKPPQAPKVAFEERLVAWKQQFGKSARLPWPARSGHSSDS